VPVGKIKDCAIRTAQIGSDGQIPGTGRLRTVRRTALLARQYALALRADPHYMPDFSDFWHGRSMTWPA
jgi:hypothetical protein